MSKSRRPRTGNRPQQVIDHLTKTGGSLTAEAIAELFGGQAVSVSNGLKKHVEAGVLQRQRVANRYEWSLPGPTEPAAAPDPDAPLQIANHADGDVVVCGHVENTDGSVTFSRKQVLQLVVHVTTPHLVLPGASTGEAVHG